MRLPKSEKGFIGIFLVIVGVFFLGGLGYFVYHKNIANSPIQPSSSIQTQASNSAQAIPSPTSSTLDTSNWKTYTNKVYGFSFKYPNIYQVDQISNNESDGSEFTESLSICKQFVGSCLDPRKVVISVFNNPQNLSVQDFAITNENKSYKALGIKSDIQSDSSVSIENKNNLMNEIDQSIPLSHVWGLDYGGQCGGSRFYIIHNNNVLKLDFICFSIQDLKPLQTLTFTN